MWEYVHKLEVADEIAAESELTEAEAADLSEDLKHEIAEHYSD